MNDFKRWVMIAGIAAPTGGLIVGIVNGHLPLIAFCISLIVGTCILLCTTED